MEDPTQQPTPQPQANPQVSLPSGYLVRHNDMIIGIFDNEGDATDAKDGYQMDNDIAIDDILDILQLT